MDVAKHGTDAFALLDEMARLLRTTREDVARSAGLEPRDHSDHAQQRLRGLLSVVSKVEPRFGSLLIAYAWYRSEPLPGFSGQTAMQLLRSGRADEVLSYIDAVDAGLHA